PRAHALPARLRPDAVPVRRHAALWSAGGARARSAHLHGRPPHRQRGARRLRLGWARGLRGGGPVARERPRARVRLRLQHPGHRRFGAAASAGARASPLVSVLLPWRAGAGGADPASPRARQAPLAALVAQLEVRRRDVRSDGSVLRQSRLRGRGDPVLPASIRAGPGRPRGGGDRGAAHRAAADHRADHRAARRGRRSEPALRLRVPPAFFHGTFRAASRPDRRSQPAAGGSARVRRGDPRADQGQSPNVKETAMNRRRFLMLGTVASGAFALGGPVRWRSTALAQPSAVPTVDRLVLTNVVDNVYDVFAKGGKRDTITVQRPPFVASGDTLLAQHGLAYHIESVRGSERREMLLDF